MAVELRVYGDESGQDEAPYCVVAGWIASPKVWDSFNLAWRKIIDDKGLSEFKSKEFFGRGAAREKGTKNPFRNWADDEAHLFLNALIGVVQDHYPRITPIGAALKREDWLTFSWGERNFITGASWHNIKKRFIDQGAPTRTYPLPFHSMVGEALALATPADCKVHFIMDEQDVILHGLQRIFAKVRVMPSIDESLRRKVGDLTPGLSHEHEGIQAADLLAYCWNRWHQRREPSRRTGEPFTADMIRGERLIALFHLLERHKRELGILSRVKLEAMLDSLLKPEDRLLLHEMTGPPKRQREPR